MKFLLLSCALLATALAAPQRREYQQNQQQQQQQQHHAQQQQQQGDYNHQDQPQPFHHQERDREHLRTTTFIPIIRFDKEQGNDGSYKAAWETGNNIIAEEEGFLKSLGPDPDHQGEEIHAQVQHGSYSYTAPDGQVIEVHYTADEHGFRPEGLHLPTPPPVSPEVQKGLDLIYAGIKAQQELAARNPQPLDKQEQDFNGQYRQ